jgi:hypothetical protein
VRHPSGPISKIRKWEEEGKLAESKDQKGGGEADVEYSTLPKPIGPSRDERRRR